MSSTYFRLLDARASLNNKNYSSFEIGETMKTPTDSSEFSQIEDQWNRLESFLIEWQAKGKEFDRKAESWLKKAEILIELETEKENLAPDLDHTLSTIIDSDDGVYESQKFQENSFNFEETEDEELEEEEVRDEKRDNFWLMLILSVLYLIVLCVLARLF